VSLKLIVKIGNIMGIVHVRKASGRKFQIVEAEKEKAIIKVIIFFRTMQQAEMHKVTSL